MIGSIFKGLHFLQKHWNSVDARRKRSKSYVFLNENISVDVALYSLAIVTVYRQDSINY